MSRLVILGAGGSPCAPPGARGWPRGDGARPRGVADFRPKRAGEWPPTPAISACMYRSISSQGRTGSSTAPPRRRWRRVRRVDRPAGHQRGLPIEQQPVCWFVAGAALLDIDPAGRRGVDLPRVKSTYCPHAINFERLRRSRLDWRLLCPGPMVDEPALGLDRMRISIDGVPVHVPAFARACRARCCCRSSRRSLRR